jgi:hypothetical protein
VRLIEAGRVWICKLRRHSLLVLSIVLYIACLPFDGFCTSGSCSGWPAYSILIWGPLGLLVSPVHWTWLANPALFAAWIAQLAQGQIPAVILSFMAFIIAISFLVQRAIITNEAGITSPVTGYGAGYWIWLASIVVSWFNSMATIELSSKSSNSNKDQI